MGVTGLHHVGMFVQDSGVYERTVTFYREVIGLAPVRQWSSPPRHITMLDFGNGGLLEIVRGAEGEGSGVFAHIALALGAPEDVDAMLERCAAWGCEVTRPAGTVEAAEEGSGRIFRFRNGFCRGPAGESLEFFCEF